MLNKSLGKSVLMTALITGSVIWGGTVVHAEEPQQFLLDEYVVTATRMENKLVDTPANMSVITSEEFEKRNYQSVSEALENVPGVIVKRSGFLGGDQHIYLNGDDRVLIMVDGRRLNQDKGTSGRSGFDITNLPSPDFIEKIEILKGAGSSLYGSDAVGGVINIITKSANKNYAKININTGSWGSQNYSALVSVKKGKTGVITTINKQKQNYVKYKEADSGDNVKWPNSSNNIIGATIKVDQEFDGDKLATLYFEHSFKDGGKPYYAPGLGGWNTIKPGASGTDLNNNISGKFEWGRGEKNTGFIQIYRNYYSGNFYDNNSDSNYYETKDGVEIQQTWELSKNNKVVVGADWRESEVNNPGTYGGKIAKINNKAIYVQDSWDFADSWLLNAGLRYDKHNFFGNKTTASVAVNKKFSEDSHAYLSWGQIFNAPQANDLFYYSPSIPGVSGAMIGNAKLKPETGEVWTIGYDTKLNDKIQLGINAFYSELDDAINWAALDPNNFLSDWTVANVAKQKKRGMEFNVKHKLTDEFSINGSYTYVKVEEDNKDGNGFKRDTNVSPNQYKIGISFNKDKWDAELYGRGASGADKSKYVDSKYLTLDLSLQYKVQKDYKIYAKAYNLTNASYAETGGVSNGKYSFPMPGRSFLIGMEYAF
ncbi:TonB-dependent receptor plug domain-containing protein [Phascolarctobacterium faecium]|jgi:vitamin B12 transporter|uniref:TonB-dependent receptor plug domain-containing protein n=1 Tax=Phascolarctobacterium faecium TaxID=33025 RepID=UPI002674B441|nr:TonB-dependent receptor [Phascolarctobacterium faecium]